MINNTFVINPVRPDYIHKCLESLYKYTDMKNNRVIVIDQTVDRLPEMRDKVHLVLRPHRNLGFSKSMNEGIIHGLRWNSNFITCMNDDVEFINHAWWSGIEETFNQDERIMAVNPMSLREPGWGYGMPHGEYIDLLPYKEEYSQKDYDWLLAGHFEDVPNLPASFPRHKVGVIDAIATWCTVFKKEFFHKFGMFEERYYPGGGEDYDINARCYRQGYRMVGTTRSWAWHWWGSSKDKAGDYEGKGLPVVSELCWLNPDQLWPPEKNLSWDENTKSMQPKGFDPWGKVTLQDGSKQAMIRDKEVRVVDI